MKKIWSCDSFSGEEVDTEYLREVCVDVLAEYRRVVKYGFFGAWDGPRFGGSVIDDPAILFGHITQDFSVPMVIELMYADEDTDVSEFQRYSGPVSLSVPKGSLVLLQHHHDGCNQYLIRAVDRDYDPDVNFIVWCNEYSKPINEECL